jgi:hypothetical protein
MSCSKNELLVKDPEVGKFPSTYWSGDEWVCPKCGHVVITGFGKGMRRLEKWGPADAFEFSWNATDVEHK